MRKLLSLGVLLGLFACSGIENSPKSSESKAAEMTHELVKEMRKQDSLESLSVDTVSAEPTK